MEKRNAGSVTPFNKQKRQEESTSQTGSVVTNPETLNADMEFMETFPLNVAHQLIRRAEHHLERKNFDESIQCYQKAAQKLKEAEEQSSDKLLLQSVRYQHERCVQLQGVVSMKKAHFLDDRARQHKMSLATKLERTYEEKSLETYNLQDQIKRTMEETDSLILQLTMRHKGDEVVDDIKSLKSDDTEPCSGGEEAEEAEATKVEGNKWPKDDRTVIEELQTVSQQLRSLVSVLMNQLSESTRETEMLRERVRFLEGERRIKSDELEGRVLMPLIRKDNLRVNTDSNGGSSSFECSPCSELSPDVPAEPLIVPSRELPVLAPLEMPNFDWATLSKKTETSEDSPTP